jgi:hypothetical protein
LIAVAAHHDAGKPTCNTTHDQHDDKIHKRSFLCSFEVRLRGRLAHSLLSPL